jgi:hypothetical protein
MIKSGTQITLLSVEITLSIDGFEMTGCVWRKTELPTSHHSQK